MNKLFTLLLLAFAAATSSLTGCAVDRAHGTLAKAGTYAPHDRRTRTVEPYTKPTPSPSSVVVVK